VKFSGLLKTSLIDYPNKIASVLYVPKCNLRCPFCHNWRIVINPKPPFLQDNTAIKILEDRRKYVNAVVITGGEPTLYKDLPDFLLKLKNKGFQIKLDTNGFFPKTLQKCIPYVDYIAMDIKTSLEKYVQLGSAIDTRKLTKSIETIRQSKVEYEFRTTLVPDIVNLEDLNQICQLITGAEKLVLQQFIPTDTLDKKFEKIEPYSKDKIEKFAKISEKHVKKVQLRL
jgi:pyruvate formate lyase activating enzyme